MRKQYLDHTRSITVILVLIYHVIYMFNSVQTDGVIGPFMEIQYQDVYQYLVYPWFMLLLFVISGMSSRFYLERHSDREFIRSRTVKLLVPSTLGLFVFWWIQGYYNMTIAGAFMQFPVEMPKVVLFFIMILSGTGVLWYIQLLWFFSVLLVFLRKFEKDRFYMKCEKAGILILLLMTPVIYLSAQVLNTPLIVVYRFGIYGMGFLIGYFILSHETVMKRLGNIRWVLSVSALLLAILFIKVFWLAPYADHVVLDSLLCNVYAWIMVLAILSMMHTYGNVESSILTWLKNKSWGLYLFHYLPISMTALYLHLYASFLPAWIHYLLCAFTGFAGALLLDTVIRRIPVLCFLVMGIKKK